MCKKKVGIGSYANAVIFFLSNLPNESEVIFYSIHNLLSDNDTALLRTH